MWLILFRTPGLLWLAWAGWHYNPVPGEPLVASPSRRIRPPDHLPELRLHRVPANHMVGALVGGVTGLLGANLVWGVIAGLRHRGEHFIHAVLIVFLSSTWES